MKKNLVWLQHLLSFRTGSLFCLALFVTQLGQATKTKSPFLCEKGPLLSSCQSLVRLYQSSQEMKTQLSPSWLMSKDICSWTRVICNKEKTQVLTLDLSHLGLKSLPQNTFTDLSSLQVLNLAYNQLKELPPPLFTPLVSLQLLDLSKNSFPAQTRLPQEVCNRLKRESLFPQSLCPYPL